MRLKPVILFFAFTMFYTSISAQVAFRPFVGLNASTLTSDFSDADWQRAAGYQAGLDVQFGNRVYFQPGIHWELINKDLVPENVIGDFSTEFQATHIRIPLLLGFRLFSDENTSLLNFRVFTGPDIAFSVSNSEHSFLGIDLSSNQYRRLHWSWNGGVGVNFLFLFLDVGYKVGLSEYFRASVGNDARTNVFFGNIGLRLKI